MLVSALPRGLFLTHSLRLLSRRPAFAASGAALRAVARAASSVPHEYHSPHTVPLPSVPYADYVLEHSASFGERAALIDAASGRTFTYASLRGRVAAAAAALAAAGVRSGDVVNLHLPNCPEYFIAFAAITSLGAINTTSNPLYTKNELTHQYRDASVRWVVTIPQLLEASRAAAEAVGVVRGFFVLGEASGAFLSAAPAAAAAAAAPAGAAISPASQLAVLPYSSGTTGLSKGVRLTHSNLVANVQQVTAHPAWNTGMPPGSVTLGLLPFFHIYGMQMGMTCTLRQGCTVVIMPRFEPLALLEALAKYRISYAALVPPIVAFLARHPAVAKFDLSALKVVFSGAAPLDGESQAALEARLPGLRVSQGYGMTESSPVTHFVDPRQRITGSVGPVAPSTAARIVDVDSGAVLPPGAANVGELWVRGPQVMQGYLNNAAADAATLRDGWLMTGDVAWADEAGNFYIVDRRKELIKTKGLQVAPAELEGLLVNHPQLAAAAAIGAPDERAGELPVVFVTRRAAAPPPAAGAPPPPPPPVDEAAVIAWLRPQVAAYKLPARVFFVDAIPTSATGKILRRELKAKLPEFMAKA